MDGRLIKTQEITNTSQIINRTEISCGVFLMTISNKQQVLATKKIILL
jgi:hypothetical protein